MGRTPLFWTSNGLEHHFSNIERTRTSFFDHRTNSNMFIYIKLEHHIFGFERLNFEHSSTHHYQKQKCIWFNTDFLDIIKIAILRAVVALIFSVQERQELQKLKDDCLHLESKQQIDYIAVDIRIWIRQALSKNVSQVLTFLLNA